MTLPTSGAISLTDVLNELRVSNPGRALPISLGDPDVLALAGLAGPAVSLSSLYGKSSITPMSLMATSAYGDADSSNNGGTVSCQPSVTITGGKAPISVLWEVLQGAVTLTGATSLACTVSRTFVKRSEGSVTAYLRVTATDAQGQVKQLEGITAQLDWSSFI